MIFFKGIPMSVVSPSFADCARRFCNIDDLPAWLEQQRSAAVPDDCWDFPHEHGLIDLHELEELLGDNWLRALSDYAVPFSTAELEVFGFCEAIICMQPSFAASGARTYPVRDGVITVFSGENFSAVFLGNDDTYRHIEQSWEALFCILSAWRHAPDQAQREAAREFLCGLVEQAMNTQE